MKGIIAWFAHNPVAANLLMWILIVGGLLALPNTHQEEFPTLEVDAVQVNVPYLGAAPAEVESGVCIRVEEAIQVTEGIDKVTSSASEGYCSVVIELVEGVDKTKLSNDIKSKVDAISSFPAETEQPVTAEVTLLATVLQIAIAGNADERTLKLIGQQLRDDLKYLYHLRESMRGIDVLNSTQSLLHDKPGDVIEQIHLGIDSFEVEEAIKKKKVILKKVRTLYETNPMLGHRGCR